jgi:hypothetical protein
MIITTELVNDLITNEATERGLPVPKTDIEALIAEVFASTAYPTDLYDADMEYLDSLSSSLFSSIDRLF